MMIGINKLEFEKLNETYFGFSDKEPFWLKLELQLTWETEKTKGY